MATGVYLVTGGNDLVSMREESYDSEGILQGLLERYPDLLAGDQIDPDAPRRWLLICREAPIPVPEDPGNHFALDHLFLDQDGVPTLVEVKRSADVRIRREVVGQMLDYAANAVAYWPVERLIAFHEARCEAEESDPDEALREALGDDLDCRAFWATVRTNLLAKRIRLLFVADRVPAELRNIIEFLNETMDPVQVLALEIRQYSDGQQRALVPRVIGQTADARQRKSAPSPPTTEGIFLASHEEPARGVYERLLAFANEQQLLVRWGTKGFSLNVVLEGQNVRILEGYPADAYRGRVYIPFSTILMKVSDPEPLVTWYRAKVEQLSCFGSAGKMMRCDSEALAGARQEALHAVLAEVVRQIREHGLAE